MYHGAAMKGRRPERPRTRAGWGECPRALRSSKTVIGFRSSPERLELDVEKWETEEAALLVAGMRRHRAKLRRQNVDNILTD